MGRKQGGGSARGGEWNTTLAFEVAELTELLDRSLGGGRWLDATLAVGGLIQALDDHLAHTSSPATRVLAGLGGSGNSAVRSVVTGASRALTGLRTCFDTVFDGRLRVVRVRNALVEVAGELAAVALGLRVADLAGEAAIESSVSAVVKSLRSLPSGAVKAPVRVPSCFRAFDQHPDDLRVLVERFVGEFGTARPVVVAGLRTSGSYMAPFVVALLKARGCQHAGIVSVRANQRLLRSDRGRVRASGGLDPLVVVVDDPPASGSAILNVCRLFESMGVARQSIVLMLALFGDDDVPDRLKDYPRVLLKGSEWSIHERLSEVAVRPVLDELLAPARVVSIASLDLPERSARRHQWARFSIETDESDGSNRFEVLAQGVGAGYFGEYEVKVSEVLPGISPRVFGFKDGVLFREWLDGSLRAHPDVNVVDGYVEQRSKSLVTGSDRSMALVGCQPVWEVASEHLAHAYGRFWRIARLLFVDKLAKLLLGSPMPSVVDGEMSVDKWFKSPNGDGFIKVGGGERSFSNLDLVDSDPAYDVVGFAMSAIYSGDASSGEDGSGGPVAGSQVADNLRALYEQRNGVIANERWFLYELVRTWDEQRRGHIDRYVAADRKASSLRRYISTTLLDGVTPAESGKVVALDVDGVIETDILGFKGPLPASVMSIRALLKHGYRPVVVTGRCSDDVKELCDLFRLSGGAAEYGSAVYVSSSVSPGGAESSPLLTGEARERLGALRSELAGRPEVHVDTRYRSCVRASSVSASGRLGPLPASMVDEITGRGFVAFDGDAQTDFVVPGVDKGVGLSALSAELARPDAGEGEFGEGGEDHEAGLVIELAIGDTDADVPMLKAATSGAVPAHASEAAKGAAGFVASRPYQAGLSEVVGRLIGHRPGGCAQCAVVLAPQAKAVMALLSVPEGSTRSVPLRSLRAMFALKVATRDACHATRVTGGPSSVVPF